MQQNPNYQTAREQALALGLHFRAMPKRSYASLFLIRLLLATPVGNRSRAGWPA